MAATDMTYDEVQRLAAVNTGDPSTVDDAYSSTPTTLSKDGSLMDLGKKVYFKRTDGSVYCTRYVRINNTVAVTFAYGQPVFWKDIYKTTVTTTMSESATAGYNSIAGILLNKDLTNGDYGYIQTSGLALLVPVPASCVADDMLIGAASQAFARIASGATVTGKIAGICLTSRTQGGTCSVWLNCD